jgi:uncharacterized protein (TIGR03084 family)
LEHLIVTIASAGPAGDMVLTEALAALGAESAELDDLVAGLPDRSWRLPTPADSWTIAHQIAHLAWTDDIALLAITSPDRFAQFAGETRARIATLGDETATARVEQQAPAELLTGWRAGRAALAEALSRVGQGARVAWFGPPMSTVSMGAARLMETWAHGQDVADALGVHRSGTDRLRFVAHIGVRTRDFSFVVHQRTPPTEPFRVELTAPSGSQWTWGPADAAQRVTGPALDFCLLVTQRRHRDDLGLVTQGADAAEWLTIAQAFAGPSGAGRSPGQFA